MTIIWMISERDCIYTMKSSIGDAIGINNLHFTCFFNTSNDVRHISYLLILYICI